MAMLGRDDRDLCHPSEFEVTKKEERNRFFFCCCSASDKIPRKLFLFCCAPFLFIYYCHLSQLWSAIKLSFDGGARTLHQSMCFDSPTLRALLAHPHSNWWHQMWRAHFPREIPHHSISKLRLLLGKQEEIHNFRKTLGNNGAAESIGRRRSSS